MFRLRIVKEVKIEGLDKNALIDALMHFSFLIGYHSSFYNEVGGTKKLVAGSIMSLNINKLKHSISVDHSVEGLLTFEVRAFSFPWERSKVREILSHRLAQLISYLRARDIIPTDSLTEEERSVQTVQSPFTHLPDKKPFHYLAAALKITFSMALCILGVVLVMWIYGIIVIRVTESRLMLEVTFGEIATKKELIGGGSVIGIAIGYAVGGVLSVYFALSELIDYLNRRILSFAIFYAIVMLLFIIEEEAVVLTSLIAVSVPFVAYAFYNIGQSMRRIYLKSDD